VRSSVQHVVQTTVHAAADLNHDSGIIPDARIKRAIRGRNRSPSQKDQFCWIAAIQRQLQTTLVIDDVTDSATPRFHESRVSRDFNARQDSSSLVLHGTNDLSGCLRPNHRGSERYKEDRGKHTCADAYRFAPHRFPSSQRSLDSIPDFFFHLGGEATITAECCE